MKDNRKKTFIPAMTAIFFIAVIAVFVVYGAKAGGDLEVDPGAGTDEVVKEVGATGDEKKEPVPVQPSPTTGQPVMPAQKAPAPPSTGDEAYTVFRDSLFIGDSRTEGFKLYSGVNNATFFCAKSMTVDRIVSGEKVKVQGVEQSIYEVLADNRFEKIYIGLGLNELGWVHIESFLAEYEALISAVKTAQPEAVIYVQALLPVTSEKSAKDKTNNNEQIYWYNINLVKLAQTTDTVYVNASEPLVGEDGALKPDATTDGVHLNSYYCKIWARHLAQIS